MKEIKTKPEDHIESHRAKGQCSGLAISSPAPAVFVLLVLLLLVPIASAQTQCRICQEDTECPRGEVCKGCPDECNATCQPIPGWPGLYKYGTCKPCATSAECVKKTFEAAIRVPGAPSPWFVIAVIACMIALLGSGTVYMIGYSFDIRQIKQIGRAELMQGLASLILVGLLFGAEWSEFTLLQMMETQTQMITAAIYSPTEYKAITQAGGVMKVNPFEVSYAFMRKLVTCARTQYQAAYDASVMYEWLANFDLSLVAKVPVLKELELLPMSGEILRIPFATKLQEKEYLADELTWLTILLHMQLAIMRFIETSMFTIFLPIGIILRAFPPTRGAGAVLIAIAIGLYIAYPMIYTLLAVSTAPVVEGCDVSIPRELTEIKKECPISTAAVTSGVTEAQASAAQFESDMLKVKNGANQLRYLVYLYFIIALGASFLFIRSISGILGADIGEIGRTMLKMM